MVSERNIEYLTVAELIEIHRQVMSSMHAGPELLRSEDLLESAAMKPQAAAYYGGADLVEQAAGLAIGISQNQPFLDGNKRTAYGAMRVFLMINGLDITGPHIDVAHQLIAVAERAGTLEEATSTFAWLRERTAPRSSE